MSESEPAFIFIVKLFKLGSFLIGTKRRGAPFGVFGPFGKLLAVKHAGRGLRQPPSSADFPAQKSEFVTKIRGNEG